jgi:chromosome segregation ATPase
MDKTQNEIEQTLSLLDKLKAKLARIAAKERPQQVMNQGEDGETEMPAEWDEERVKALEEKVASLDEAVTNMRAEVNALAGVVKDLQGESESFLKREKDMKWNEVKAHVAPGLVHKDREAEMRKLWENDPASFVLKALTYKEEPPKAEGIMFTAKDGTKIGAEEQLKRLRIPAIDVEGVQ